MLFIVRMFLMGLHFLAVGGVGLLIGLCRPFHPDNSRVFARLYSRPAIRILGLTLDAQVRPLFEQPPGCVIIANHQSNYDLFVLGQVVPRRTVCIGKKSLKWVPFFGQLFWLGGNVLINRGNAYQARRALQTTTRTLKRDTSIWVFPEGTRNQGSELLAFKKGAFQMAIDAGVPIVPLCVSRYARSVRWNRWRAGRVAVRSLPAIPTQGLTSKDIPALMQQCREQMQACIDELERQLQHA
ncbi:MULTISPECIES: lysophospholipid acyltransferase family protein [Pseudomonas]|uniref:1-acyl-sn-glycerol-3-phosphate acyltransferase n=1 Tax=Pseudomonas eucalypticola TaxID=2599595 RepID=A0A7D5D9H9_9PSED|nr:MULTISPECIES: 1-acylglycerol-3-phosphate O-acyltransferase [Pseudomonas]QKZ06132.1 1-acylglycerol-3-phosphate O-acyltransferase [Pseudomonas eucalypticola]